MCIPYNWITSDYSLISCRPDVVINAWLTEINTHRKEYIINFSSTTEAHKILIIVLKVAMTVEIFNLNPSHLSWFISGQYLPTSFAKTGLMMSLYYQLSR